MNKKALILISITLFIGNLFGSIFDTYGIGRVGINYSVASVGRGYTSALYNDNKTVNFQNPASLAMTEYAGFNLGINSHFNDIDPFGSTESLVGFSYGIIKFPFTKKGGCSIGLVPIASANSTYNIESSDIGYSEQILNNGKIYSANINIGYKILPFLDVGLGYEFLTGGYNFVKDLSFVDESMVSAKLTSDLGIDGRQLSTGVILSLKDKLSFGISYSYIFDINQQIINTYSAKGNYYSLKDTTFSNDKIFPNKLDIGITYNISKKYRLNLEFLTYGFNNIDKVNPVYESGGINNYSHFGFGLEKNGENSIFDSFFEKMIFRTGCFYNNNYYHNSSDEAVVSKGITFGIGIPYNKFKSRIDLSFVWERNSGTIYEDLNIDAVNIDENVYRIQISFLTTEKWFNTKGKYR